MLTSFNIIEGNTYHVMPEHRSDGQNLPLRVDTVAASTGNDGVLRASFQGWLRFVNLLARKFFDFRGPCANLTKWARRFVKHNIRTSALRLRRIAAEEPVLDDYPRYTL